MENKMKKLIALFAVSAVASTSAVAAIALSGTASVSYDDNGTAASATSYDADLSIVGTAGTTTVTVGMDLEATTGPATTAVDMATTIGPVTIAADMYNEVSKATTEVAGGQRNEGSAADDTGVTISVDAPIGDATVAVDDSGVLTVTGTWSGITMSASTGDLTTASGSIAGMDVAVTNDGGATTWTLGTTVSGVAVTLASSQKVTATFGLAGNTMVVSSIPAVAVNATGTTGNIAGTHATEGYGTFPTSAVVSYSTVAISRSLTSGATLAATYSTKDDSLTLKASVAF